VKHAGHPARDDSGYTTTRTYLVGWLRAGPRPRSLSHLSPPRASGAPRRDGARQSSAGDRMGSALYGTMARAAGD